MYTLLSLRMGLSMLWLFQEVAGEGFFGVDYGSKAFDLLTLVVSSNYVSLKCLQEKKKTKTVWELHNLSINIVCSQIFCA